jgi:geranylgeranyl reductase family protein
MRYDVIIVGGGPAGTSTALHLAEMAPEIAARTLVLERDRHPRHKLCGGACPRDVDVCLDRLGLDIDEVPHLDVSWVHLRYRGRGFRMRLTPNSDHAFRVVERHEFDAWLAGKVRQRGIELLEETRVTGLHRRVDGVAVETTRGCFEAPVVVGADGATSVVRKLVAPGSHSKVARLLELFTPATAPQGNNGLVDVEAYLEFSCLPSRRVQGYTWTFPMNCSGNAVRNWGAFDSRVVPRPTSRSLKPVVADWLADHSYRLSDYKLEGHPIRLFDRRGPLSASNALLVGDAAGVDPVFGEGISMALGYGGLAAEAICDAFADRDFSFRDYRRRVLRSPLGKSLNRRAWAAEVAFRLPYPAVQKLLWWRLGPVLRWSLQKYIFNWAERTPPFGRRIEAESRPVSRK